MQPHVDLNLPHFVAFWEQLLLSFMEAILSLLWITCCLSCSCTYSKNEQQHNGNSLLNSLFPLEWNDTESLELIAHVMCKSQAV